MRTRRSGFTIIELVVVVAVIAILVGIVTVAYGPWRQQTIENKLKSDLQGAAAAMESARNTDGKYSVGIPRGFSPSDGVTMGIKSGNGAFCIEATSPELSGKYFSIKNKQEVAEERCGDYISIAAGSVATCAVAYKGTYCWGSGNGGQLGNGSTSGSATPVGASIPAGTVTEVAVGTGTACGVIGGKAYCWGSGSSGELGNGSTTNSLTPVPVNTAVMTGTVTSISVGSSHVCAVADNKAYCWGGATYGQLGNASQVSSSVPVAVDTSIMRGAVTDISVNGQTSCAVAGGKAYCWGSASNGILGANTSYNSAIPVAVNTTIMGGTVSSIAVGGTHVCAVAGGKAYCWGSGASGRLGNSGTANSPVPVAVTSSIMSGGVTAVSAGSNNTCAIADAKAYCWGVASNGSLGNGATSNYSTAPVVVATSLMTGAVSSIATGDSHTCAVADSKAYCWGLGNGGQLGNNSYTTAVPNPVAVGALPAPAPPYVPPAPPSSGDTPPAMPSLNLDPYTGDIYYQWFMQTIFLNIPQPTSGGPVTSYKFEYRESSTGGWQQVGYTGGLCRSYDCTLESSNPATMAYVNWLNGSVDVGALRITAVGPGGESTPLNIPFDNIGTE